MTDEETITYLKEKLQEETEKNQELFNRLAHVGGDSMTQTDNMLGLINTLKSKDRLVGGFREALFFYANKKNWEEGRCSGATAAEALKIEEKK